MAQIEWGILFPAFLAGMLVLSTHVPLGQQVLARGIVSSADIPAAIGHYFTGVEVCGTRYVDRSLAGPTGSLADSQSALGYIIGPRRAAADDINGLDVVIEFGGKQIYAAPAKHGFGNVLASLRAYADRQHASLPLTKGTIITSAATGDT